MPKSAQKCQIERKWGASFRFSILLIFLAQVSIYLPIFLMSFQNGGKFHQSRVIENGGLFWHCGSQLEDTLRMFDGTRQPSPARPGPARHGHLTGSGGLQRVIEVPSAFFRSSVISFPTSGPTIKFFQNILKMMANDRKSSGT